MSVRDGEGVCPHQAADSSGCVWIPPAFPSADPPYAAVYGVLSPEGDTPGRDRLRPVHLQPGSDAHLPGGTDLNLLRQCDKSNFRILRQKKKKKNI